MEAQEFVQRIIDARHQISSSGGYTLFYEFLDKDYPKTDGLSKPNLTKMVKKYQSGSDLPPTTHHLEWLEILESRVEAYSNRVSDRSDLFHGTNWYLYFHYNYKYIDPNVSLGRAVLMISDSGSVTLKNIKDGYSCDYKGHFQLYGDYFMTFSLDGAKEGHKLQLKIITSERPRDLCIGLSLSYEQQRIVSNKIVLYRLGHDANLEPLTLASTLSKKESNPFFDVPEPIRKYLSLRRQSMMTSPKAIYDLDRLDALVNNFHSEKKYKAYDYDLPKAFISTPTDSIEADDQESKAVQLSQMINDLEILCGQNESDVEFFYPGRFNMKSTNQKLKYHNQIASNLEDLQYYKFFIMIYDDNVPSRSMVELGFALARCRCVLLLFDRKKFDHQTSKFPVALSVLENRKSFGVFKMLPFKGSIREEYDYIKDAIFKFITSNYREGRF